MRPNLAAMVQERQSVAVVGVGSIGGVAAASLAATGRYDVTACMRNPVNRLTLEYPGGASEVAFNAPANPAEVTPVDWVLLATKAQSTVSTAPWLARLCGPQTRVAVMQNGIEHAARVAAFVGKAKVVPVIVYYNGERLAPDRVRLRRVLSHDLIVGDDVDAAAFADLFAGSPLSVQCSDDFVTVAWRKLLLNVVANPITALTLQRQAVFQREDICALGRDVAEEAAAVGRAAGAKLVPDEVDLVMTALRKVPADSGSSMYFDRLAGRSLEIEALTGAIVAAGARYGIATPLNRALLILLRTVSDAASAKN
jgi:2-dehydropantoate 2-reductase